MLGIWGCDRLREFPVSLGSLCGLTQLHLIDLPRLSRLRVFECLVMAFPIMYLWLWQLRKSPTDHVGICRHWSESDSYCKATTASQQTHSEHGHRKGCGLSLSICWNLLRCLTHITEDLEAFAEVPDPYYRGPRGLRKVSLSGIHLLSCSTWISQSCFENRNCRQYLMLESKGSWPAWAENLDKVFWVNLFNDTWKNGQPPLDPFCLNVFRIALIMSILSVQVEVPFMSQ